MFYSRFCCKDWSFGSVEGTKWEFVRIWEKMALGGFIRKLWVLESEERIRELGLGSWG